MHPCVQMNGACDPTVPSSHSTDTKNPALLTLSPTFNSEISSQKSPSSSSKRRNTIPSTWRQFVANYLSNGSTEHSGSILVEDFNFRFVNERRAIRDVMLSPRFDFVIGMIIVSNCVSIGVEQTWELQGRDTSLCRSLEHMYLLIYLVEICFRFFAFHLRCLEDNWVKFDLFLVLTGILTGWILQPIIGHIDQLGPLMVLRMARLVRLARTMRLLIKFRELWMLVRGLLHSASTMFYTLIILLIMLYIFSCLSVELITKHPLATEPNADPEFKSFVEDNFKDLPITMLTLLQFATLDNMNLLYMPLVRKSWWLGFYFIGIILVISIALMNLVTAVIVNSALEQATSDKEAIKAQEEKRRKKLMKDLRKVFLALDDDNSGQVTKEEMTKMTGEDRNLLYSILGTADPIELFAQLDVDDSGELEIEEFCDGIWQVAKQEGGIEIKRLEKQVHVLRNAVSDLISKHDCTENAIRSVLASVDRSNGVASPEHTHERCLESFQKEALGTPLSPFPDGFRAWQDNVVRDLRDWKSILNIEVQETLDKLHSVGSRIIPLGENHHRVKLVSLGESHRCISVAAPLCAEDLRLQSLRASDSIKSMKQEYREQAPSQNQLDPACTLNNDNDLEPLNNFRDSPDRG